MKYGVILYNYGEKALRETGYNLGDPIQTLAVEKIYAEMNISADSIIYINLCDLKTYEGEYVLLPMLGVGLGVGYAPFPLSPKIIPLFLSSHIRITELTQEEVLYLKKFAPIGCRDEYSLRTMRKYHIPCYLSGCITTLFDKRNSNVSAHDIYLIDIPDSLNKYIPKEILEHAKIETHLLPLPKKAMTEDEAKEMLFYAEKRLQEYKRNAKLVISSRMHALVPCMAMGIPVISVFENISYRFSWLDKYLKLYTEDDFQEIDWNPIPINYENEKRMIRSVFKKKIQETYDYYNDEYALSDFYENRRKSTYGNMYLKKILSVFPNQRKFDYIIWGCGLIGNTMYELMQEHFPDSKLIVAIDEYESGMWHGVPIITSKEIQNYPNVHIFIASYSAKEYAYKILNNLDRKENVDYTYIGTING